MSDENGNATTSTIWEDNHSGLRRHKLMTKELADTIPPLYANDGADDPDAVVAKAKLFSAPTTAGAGTSPSGTPRPDCASASSRGSRQNSATSTSPSWRRSPFSASVPAVERDLYWAPQTLGEIRRQSRLAA